MGEDDGPGRRGQLLVSRPLLLLKDAPANRAEKWRSRAIALYEDKRAKALLGVIGALALGVIGNKMPILSRSLRPT